jgi:dynein heavy chain
MVAMFSGEKEKINFIEPVDPRDRGVEFWMGDVEKMMQDSVRHVLHYSVTDYAVTDRNDWIKKHPGQCILNGSQVHWTKEVEEAIQNKTIGDYVEKLQDQLLDTVKLVRTKLTKQ